MWVVEKQLVVVVCMVGVAAQGGSGHAAAADAAPIVLDPAQPGPEFDGHGGLSAGGTSRLLIEYPEPQRSELLDYLFLPNFGAAVQVLKLEIGGDTQSTDGTETSHMHFRGDLGCARGYEGWLAKEAKARNPDIKIWSLSWGVPGWIGNVSGSPPTYYCDDNIQYQISWLKCLKDTWGVDSDYLGLWNERPQGSTQYVESLRAALDSHDFGHVGITVEATWEELLRKAVTDSKFNASIVAGSAHYPCNATINSEAAANASKKWWAGEDNTGGLGPDYHDLDRTGNWTGASCWGRKLSQHFIKMGATSTVAWSLIWAAAPGVSSNGDLATSRHGHGFLGNGFLNATEPWSGHYDVPPVLWINAHWHHFANAGWRFLANATAEVTGGSGWLPGGGSYVTLVPPEGSETHPANTFTLIVETLTGTCGAKCNANPITETQSLSFELQGPLASASRVALWCSSESAVFAKQPDVAVAKGMLRLSMKPDTICTATTLLTNGTKGTHPSPPSSTRCPKIHWDDFTNCVMPQQQTVVYLIHHDAGLSQAMLCACAVALLPDTVDTLPRGFSDVYGSFAVRPTSSATPNQLALTQVATAKPTGWAPTNLDPLTLFGDSMWTDVTVAVKAMINHTAHSMEETSARTGDPPPPPIQPDYVKICGGCGDTSMNGLSYGCAEACCFRIAYSGNWTLGGSRASVRTGVIEGFKDTWHNISLAIHDGAVTATVDGATLATLPGSCVPPSPIVFPGHGMVGLGCGAYHYCQYSSIKIEAM